jgi:hypothetical protein
MRFVANDPPPADLLARSSILGTFIASICVIIRIGGQRFVRCHDNGVLSKNLGVTLASRAMIRIYQAWILQLGLGFFDPLANKRDVALKPKTNKGKG